MPRTARTVSRLRIYHVMMRGINRQQIFFEEDDYTYFAGLLQRFKESCGYQLLAYCLMGNHVHLLIQTGDEVALGEIFRHIGSAFVFWYNLKYERTGHLFQDRFRSEPVEDSGYLLTVFRYILMNPVKAGFCQLSDDYPYSSARQYFRNWPGITDTEYILNLLSINQLKAFMDEDNDDQCMDINDTVRKGCTDESARQMILRELGSMSPVIGKARERQSLNASLQKLLDSGISIRQLSRLTGISRKVIENAKK